MSFVTELLQLPPVALDAEENVISACMMSPKAIETCSEILDGHEFYRESHEAVYRACVNLWERSEAVDAITVVGELTKTGLLKVVNGEDQVYELATLAPSSSNAGHYANIVRETYLARELVTAGTAITRLGMDRAAPIEDLISQADAQVLSISDQLERRKDSVFTGKQLAQSFRERMARPEDAGRGIETPFPSWLKPFKAGRLYVVGGYQGDGKSVFAVQALRAACEAGARVGFPTLEMNRDDLTDRLVSTFGVPLARIAEEDISGYEDIVAHALSEIEGWDFEIIDDEELDPAAIRRAQRRGKYDLLIIDHLHRMKYDRRHQRASVGENVIRINNIARKFEIPVILLAQLRRGASHDPFPRPTMADFRETSEIESEASMCLFVWRIRKNGERTNEAELIVGKNRFGAEGSRNLRFRASEVRFEMVGGAYKHQTEGGVK